MIRCIYCKKEIVNSRKEWYYKKNYYLVKLFDFPNCSRSFSGYYHNNKFSHTIPKYFGLKSKILKLLNNNTASSEEIAKDLGIEFDRVFQMIKELEKDGKIEKV